MDDNLEHPENADEPILVRLFGMEMKDKLIQFLKALLFIDVTPLPIITFCNAVFINVLL